MANNHRRGPGGRMMPGEKPKNFGGTLKQLLHYMGRYKIGLLFVAIFAIGSTVFNIRGPKVMGQARYRDLHRSCGKGAGHRRHRF